MTPLRYQRLSMPALPPSRRRDKRPPRPRAAHHKTKKSGARAMSSGLAGLMMWPGPRAGSVEGGRQVTAPPARRQLEDVTVPNQHGKAEEFAAEAVKYLGQGGGAETAAVRRALAQ